MDKSILETVHESAKSLYDAGLVDVVTMHEFDAMCLPPVKELSSTEIKKIRLREKLSQPVFAHVLNVSPSTIKHWEAGDKQPSGAALKLLNVISQRGMSAVI
jgi:putative transcriptional regulator